MSRDGKLLKLGIDEITLSLNRGKILHLPSKTWIDVDLFRDDANEVHLPKYHAPHHVISQWLDSSEENRIDDIVDDCVALDKLVRLYIEHTPVVEILRLQATDLLSELGYIRSIYYKDCALDRESLVSILSTRDFDQYLIEKIKTQALGD